MTTLFKTILLGLTLALCTVCRADSPKTASARPNETDLPGGGGATLPRKHPGTVRFMTYNVRIFCGMAHPNAGKVVESAPAIRDRLIGIIDRPTRISSPCKRWTAGPNAADGTTR